MLTFLVFLLFSWSSVFAFDSEEREGLGYLSVFVAERESLPYEHVVSITGKQPYEYLA